MYAYMNPDPVFGSFGAAGDWWEALSYETKLNIQNWIAEKAAEFGVPIDVAAMQAEARRLLRESGIESPRITAEMITARVLRMILEGYARPVADGGGFAVYEPATGVSHCMCVTSPGSSVPTAQVTGRCPKGTGGMPLTGSATINRKVLVREQVAKVAPKPPVPGTTMATIKGKVVDASGIGVAGASVVVGPPGGGTARVGMMASAVAGSDGSFSADVVPAPAGTVDVSVEAAGYVGATASGVPAVRGSTTDGVMIPLVAIGAQPITCGVGLVLGPDGVSCVPIGGGGGGGDGGAGTYCPEGFVMASDGVSCVALGEKSDEGAKPWYKKTSTWMIAGGVVIVGVGIAIGWPRRRR